MRLACRALIILIDSFDSPVPAQMYLREQLAEYIKTTQPGNVFAIFQMDTSMHLVQDFTSDPEVLLRAVESKRDMPIIPPLPFHGP